MSGSVAAGVLNFSVAATSPDSRGEVVVTWDGDANANVLSFLATPQDLTAGGHRSLRVRVASAGAGTEIVFDVYSDASNASAAARRLPAIGAVTDFYFSYGPGADFVPRLGSGADFSTVRAIVMTVRGTETTATIDLVDTGSSTTPARPRPAPLSSPATASL